MRLTVLSLLLATAAAFAAGCGSGLDHPPREDLGAKDTLRVESTAFTDGAAIPSKHTADGEDASPPLAWTARSEGAARYALVADDPDAPGGTWVHWVIWNLAEPKLAEAVKPDAAGPGGAVQGKNSFGKLGYGGPSPPSGTHRYVFKVYALDGPLSLGADAGKEELLAAMRGHVLAYGELMGTYTRK